MTSRDNVEPIDISQYPELADIVEKIYIRGKNLYIELKNPKKVTIIATIKNDFTSFRKEIERLLKEKGVDKKDAKSILNLLDNNHAVFYKDEFAAVPNDYNNLDKKDMTPNASDASDSSDALEIKIVNVSECLKLHKGAVQAAGNIVGITEPFKMISSVDRKCDCGIEKKAYDPPQYTLSEDDDKKCPKCEKFFKYIKSSIEYKNAITVYLQDNEKFNDIEKLTCILLDIDTESIIVGEKVNIKGNIHIRPKSNQIYLIPKVFADKLDYVNREQITINDRDIESIERFAKLKGSSIIDSLVDMYDKSIIGNNIAKEALLYSLVSSGDDLQDIKKHKARNRLNVLLAGNPGLGKSSLLKKAITLLPNSRYESVQHSSAKSLTAIVSKEDEQHFLRLGPIPVAKGSVCGLNEIGTMTPDDQNNLLDIMEEGEFTINKHGFNSKIQSPTTIIATTNLKSPNNYDYGYDAQSSSSLYQLPLEKQILDRFDFIIILKDNGDIEALEKYTEKKMELQSSIIPNYDCFLQKYIDYARKIKPIVSPEAKKMIQHYYLNLNKKTLNPNFESKRKLETITRLCKAVAKLKLKEIVESEDVTDATRFYNAMTFNYMGYEALIPKDPVKMTIDRCKAILKDNQETPIMFADLIKQVCDKDEYIKSYLVDSSKRIEEDGKSLGLDKNRKVRRISELLCNDKNVAVVNKKPIKLQFMDRDASPCQSDASDGSDRVVTMAPENMVLNASPNSNPP